MKADTEGGETQNSDEEGAGVGENPLSDLDRPEPALADQESPRDLVPPGPTKARPGRRTAIQSDEPRPATPEAAHEVPAPPPLEDALPRPSPSPGARLEALDVEAREQVVTINIGRIEVRAVNPEKPATDDRGPALSLEEYMKRRDRRGQ